MLSAIVMSVALGAILGGVLAPDKGLATLPMAMMVIGTAIASLPAALLMRHYGRRVGFLLGASLGLSGSLLCALALQKSSFVLFVTGHLLLGSYQGFANYYRFAAVEATDPNHASRAISWVVAGGVLAAFLGPQLGQWGRDWAVSGLFVGSYSNRESKCSSRDDFSFTRCVKIWGVIFSHHQPTLLPEISPSGRA
ncbi:MFS transporter [Polaromonas sp. AER18D-145]|uniref:MFS transporter n=1 Tax=Polaromonas sp. AER18D-145 TaxID=1977060 RepID=UPI00197CA715|nr:MFS transporter [Polaromonas sp. AER18D-145]